MSEISQFLRTLIDSPEGKNIFEPGFQSYEKFCAYFEEHFAEHSNVHEFFKGRSRRDWSATEFQALYVACWVYKPMEKGTYFLRLTDAEAKQVKTGYDRLPGRKSSHLGGKGKSAHAGWAFLKGYHELLVQWQRTGGRTYLMLKCEGHTTGITGVIPHLKSWRHKKKHGVGLTANPALQALAKQDNPLVERGAENFSTEYKEFLKSLNVPGGGKMQKATTSVRDMLVALTGEPQWKHATNKAVQTRLTTLAALNAPVNGRTLAAPVKAQFLSFAKLFELEHRPEATYERYFEEIHVNPAQLTNAIRDFREEDSPVALKAQTQRRAAMLTT